MTNRIKLTDDFFDIVKHGYKEFYQYTLNLEANFETKEEAEQLKKQIIEDYEFREKHDRRFDGIKTIKELQEQLKELRVYKARYEEIQERYLNGTEKYFGEILSLYFEDEPYPKEILGRGIK